MNNRFKKLLSRVKFMNAKSDIIADTNAIAPTNSPTPRNSRFIVKIMDNVVMILPRSVLVLDRLKRYLEAGCIVR